ncbi:hypothetical protein KKC49_02715 [Patescibacteria group bacterium]|nr:hypothetical protein [Patescibacteria group bacterium]
MKATMTIYLVVFLVFGFSSIASAQEIPGGIVYSDGKNAIYKEFKTGKTTNLTTDLPTGTVVKNPVAISEDAQILVWLQNSEFWVKKIPNGKPLIIAISATDEKEERRLKVLLQPTNIKRITISPNNDYIAYESYSGEIGWFQIPLIDFNSADKEKSYTKVSTQTNAAFPYWSRDFVSKKQTSSPILVYIRKTTNRYGPIVIRKVKTENPDLLTQWEIPVVLANCEGMAYKSINGLTYFSAGKIFRINLNMVETLIEENQPNKEPSEEEWEMLKARMGSAKPEQINQLRKNPVVIAIRNVGMKDIIYIKSGSIITQGITGRNFHWVSGITLTWKDRHIIYSGSDTLIFSANDGALYSWIKKVKSSEPRVNAKGRSVGMNISYFPLEKKKLLEKAPLVFSYCKCVSIAEIKKTETSPNESKK